jgi:hypothetical protein
MRDSKDSSPRFERVRRVAAELGLAGVTTGTRYGTPALKVEGKVFCRMREPDVLVLRCPLDDKQLPIGQRPELWSETDRDKGWRALLRRLSRADDDDPRSGLLRASRQTAPRRPVRAWRKPPATPGV